MRAQLDLAQVSRTPSLGYKITFWDVAVLHYRDLRQLCVNNTQRHTSLTAAFFFVITRIILNEYRWGRRSIGGSRRRRKSLRTLGGRHHIPEFIKSSELVVLREGEYQFSFFQISFVQISTALFLRKNHARALDSMQASLEAEARAKAEALRIKKKLETVCSFFSPSCAFTKILGHQWAWNCLGPRKQGQCGGSQDDQTLPKPIQVES